MVNILILYIFKICAILHTYIDYDVWKYDINEYKIIHYETYWKIINLSIEMVTISFDIR